MYLDRLLDRVKHEKGVTFKEFRDFCQFLNNLEDFSIAMRMYTLSDQAISKGKLILAFNILKSIMSKSNGSRRICTSSENMHRANAIRAFGRYSVCNFRRGR